MRVPGRADCLLLCGLSNRSVSQWVTAMLVQALWYPWKTHESTDKMVGGWRVGGECEKWHDGRLSATLLRLPILGSRK